MPTLEPDMAIASAPTTLPGPAGLSREERLLLLLSFARHDEAEGAALDALAQDPALDWPALHDLAARNAIRPLAYKHLAARGHAGRIPPALAGAWADHVAEIAARNARRLEIARPVFADAAAAGIRIAILKGIHFGPRYYGDPGYKRMNDVDFLMPVERLDEMLALYAKHDFFSLGHLVEGDEKQVKFSHHTPPFFHRSLDCVLGTHWGLISPLTKYKPDHAAMWTRAVPFSPWADVPGIEALHPVDNVHHLGIHLPYYKAGLREVGDIYNLLRAEPEFDWALLGQEVDKAGSHELMFHALSLVQALVPMPGVAAFLARLRPRVAGFYLADTARRVREPRRILHGRSTHMAEIDKAFGEFQLVEDFPTKWRTWRAMWGNAMFAPRAEVARFHYVDPGAWWLPALYPSMFARVLRYVAKDLGWPILGLVTVKGVADLFEAAFRDLTGRKKESKLERAAKREGLGPEQLARLRDLLE